MSHAEKCPVCGGSGQMPKGHTMTGVAYKPCHGCKGKGWVSVPDQPYEGCGVVTYPDFVTTSFPNGNEYIIVPYTP